MALPKTTHAPIRALAYALFDRGQGLVPARLDWMIADLSDFLDGAGPKTRWLFIVNLLVLDLLAMVLRKRLKRLRSLSPEEGVAFLEALDESNLAILIALPKAMLSLIYFEHPDAAAETGFDGRPLIPARTQA
ncbi:MAG: hypothetical protein U1E65_14335 [Myxococcota bacterium]